MTTLPFDDVPPDFDPEDIPDPAGDEGLEYEPPQPVPIEQIQESLETPSTVINSVPAGTNLLSNPSFEVNLTGWTASNGTATRVTTEHLTGTAAAKLQSASSGRPRFQHSDLAVTIQAYTLNGSLKIPVAPAQGYFLLAEWVNGSNVVIGSMQTATASGVIADWTQYSISGTPTAGTANVRISLIAVGTSAVTTDIIYLDEIAFQQNSAVNDSFSDQPLTDVGVERIWTKVTDDTNSDASDPSNSTPVVPRQPFEPPVTATEGQ